MNPQGLGVPLQFGTASRVVIVAGKGGVGKTTVTAAAALGLARTGRRVLAVEVDGTGALRRLLATGDASSELGSDSHRSSVASASPLVPGDALRVAAIEPEPALVKYLADHGLGRLGARLTKSGMLGLVATAIPGIRDLVVLGRIRQLAEADNADVVLVDAPAAGHALGFLRTPTDIIVTARSGPIRQQADAAREFIADGENVTISLIATPQATPIRELIETAYSVEEELDLTLGPVVVNSVEREVVATSNPTEADGFAASFLNARRAAEQTHLASLAAELSIPAIHLPRLDRPAGAGAELDSLVDVLMGTQ